jgi:hypothetical protein
MSFLGFSMKLGMKLYIPCVIKYNLDILSVGLRWNF